ncbi:MAG TPA: glycosyltransferase family 4 protein [Stellaceae bacterium]|nr:glycosyltransferase family 4 protein [Stellaceae bacterium]
MKIAYLSPYFWPENIGSAPYCTDLADWLRGKGHELRVIAFRPHYPSAATFAAWQDGSRDREWHNGADIRRIRTRGRGSGGFRERLASDLAFLAGVLRHGAGRDLSQSDVIVAYVPSCLSLFGAAVLSWRSGAPVVGVVHDIESGLAAALGIARHGLLLRLMRRVERAAFNRATRIVVLTDGMAAELRDIGYRNPVTVLPIWSAALSPAKSDSDTAPVVGYSGNFGKKQNLDQLLPLIQKLNERRRDVRVVLRGDGSERRRIEAAIAAMGVSNTEFLPLVPPEQICASLQSIDLHLVPQAMNVARYALPSKLFTIMAAGRPFVCVAEADSPLDHLARKSGAGLCIQPGDEERLFAEVSRLLADRDLLREMGGRGRTFVAANMDRARILEAYEEIIAGVAAARPAPAPRRRRQERPVT